MLASCVFDGCEGFINKALGNRRAKAHHEALFKKIASANQELVQTGYSKVYQLDKIECFNIDLEFMINPSLGQVCKPGTNRNNSNSLQHY